VSRGRDNPIPRQRRSTATGDARLETTFGDLRRVVSEMPGADFGFQLTKPLSFIYLFAAFYSGKSSPVFLTMRTTSSRASSRGRTRALHVFSRSFPVAATRTRHGLVRSGLPRLLLGFVVDCESLRSAFPAFSNLHRTTVLTSCPSSFHVCFVHSGESKRGHFRLYSSY
jgi:hypothetical protein